MGRGIGLIVALLIAAFSLLRYFASSEQNPVTGESQRLGGVTMEQEVALGMEAAPQRVNAFALPGGQVFVTAGLAARLKTEGQLAGVLAHEIGHVVGRHGAEHVAKQQLTQGLTGAAVLATYDPQNPTSQGRATMIMMAGQLVNMRYGREDELESDRLGVKFMSEAGYDPRSMIGVMEVLAGERGGGGAPEFFSTHPNPENRIGKLQEAIQEQFPQGVPTGLRP
jgi:predicted Zn-dependent protease